MPKTPATALPRIAAFGLRTLPPSAGCAGAEKFAEELFTRLVDRGFQVTAYNRYYDQPPTHDNYRGIRLVHLRTVRRKGFDTLLHSLKATAHIIRHDTGDIVHIQNGGNSVFAIVLRLFGKQVFLSQDGVDWSRGKWPWYGRLFLYLSSFLTAYGPNRVIFDNVFAKEMFEKRFRRTYDFIPFGSEVIEEERPSDVLERLGLRTKEYFLFVGRFIPDKGLQYLIPAFNEVKTDKKLVLVGGSPNPAGFESELRATKDPRILFPGFIYGRDVHVLMRNAYAYIQPSDVEGLSPVILENMGLGTPVICSDIRENRYVVADTALLFRRGNVGSLREAITIALRDGAALEAMAATARARARANFSWDTVTDQHVALFTGAPGAPATAGASRAAT